MTNLVSKSRANIAFAVLIGLATYLCFWNIATSSLSPADESLHTRVAQEMWQSGNLWTPTLYGDPYFNKPPLKMWLTQIPLWLWGEGNLSYRFISSLAGVGTVAVLFMLAQQALQSVSIGFIACVSIMGWRCFIEFHGARQAVQDSQLLFFCTLALYFCWRFFVRLQNQTPRWAEAIAAGVCVGAACLTKSVVGFLPFIVFLPFLARYRNRLSALKQARWQILVMILIGLAIPLAFYVPHWISTPGAFVASVTQELTQRAIQGYHNQGQYFFYLQDLATTRNAISLVLLTASALLVGYKLRQTAQPFHLFILIWALLPILIFSIPNSKLAWYLAPAYPGFALLLGVCMVECWHLIRRGPLVTFSSVSAALLLMYGATEIGRNLARTTSRVANTPRQEILDLVASTVKSSGKKAVIVGNPTFQSPRELVYFDMLRSHSVQAPDIAQAKALIEKRTAHFVVLPSAETSALRAELPPKSIIFGPRPVGKRPLAVASYTDEVNLLSLLDRAVTR